MMAGGRGIGVLMVIFIATLCLVFRTHITVLAPGRNQNNFIDWINITTDFKNIHQNHGNMAVVDVRDFHGIGNAGLFVRAFYKDLRESDRAGTTYRVWGLIDREDWNKYWCLFYDESRTLIDQAEADIDIVKEFLVDWSQDLKHRTFCGNCRSSVSATYMSIAISRNEIPNRLFPVTTIGNTLIWGNQSHRYPDGSVTRFNQVGAWNDCLYTNMDKYEYLANIDLDEFILPKNVDSIYSLMQQLQSEYDKEGRPAGFGFPEVQFCDSLRLDEDLGIDRVTDTYDVIEGGHKVKSVIVPPRAYYINSHIVWKSMPGYRSNVRVPPSRGIKPHYRDTYGEQDILCWNSTEKNFATRRFQTRLKDKIRERLADFDMFRIYV